MEEPVKFDLLVTDVQDIIAQCLRLLQKHNKIDPNLSLRQAYDRYIHPDVLPVGDEKLWDAIDSGDILKFFQFEEQVGRHTLRLLQPRTPVELANCNSVMRLMAQEKGGETPSERYYRMKSDMSQWKDEMNSYGLTEKEQKVLEKYYLPSYATPAQQEDLMLILMDKDICGFSLAEANAARKICSKKKMDKIEELHRQVMEKASSPQIGVYVWETAIKNQLGYSFSLIHSLSYSYVGIQTAFLSTYFDPLYWNCACLRVMSGLEEDDTTSYNKTAKAIGEIKKHGIKISTIDINKSSYYFEPDEESNSILYGMKAISGINGDMIQEIENGRPFRSFDDFKARIKTTKTSMLSLIKSGAFDEFGDRHSVMESYISEQSELKSKLTMQNLAGLIEKGLIPDSMSVEKRTFRFNKSLRAECKYGDYYKIEGRYYTFYQKFFDIDDLEPVDGITCIKAKIWQKTYTKAMDPVKKFISENQEALLSEYNGILFHQQWDQYASGSISKWEMDSLGFYAGCHELAGIDIGAYGISNFGELPDDPVIEKTVNGKYQLYKLSRIVGTVIGKNDVKSIFTILTVNDGPIDIRMPRELYAHYNRRLSEVMSDGTKKVVEDGWFSRGNLLMVCGFRRNNTFVAKRYKNTPSSILYKITKVNGRTVELTDCRAGDECDEEV